MQRILSTDLWKQVRAKAAKAKRRQAAIAFVTRDLIGFKSGDRLVVSASNHAIRTGETDAKLLIQLFDRGVELYDCPGLHGKVLLLDDTAVIGSAKLSASSESKLVEVALMTDAPATVSQVASLIEQLIEQSQPITAKRLQALAKIEVLRKGGMGPGGPKRQRAKVTELGTRTWLVGISTRKRDLSADEETAVENSLTRIVEERGMRRESITWLRWTGKGALSTKAKAGDQVIQIWCPSRNSKTPESVTRPTPILFLERVERATIAYVEEPKGRKAEMKWSEFKQLMKHLGYGRRFGKSSQCILAPALADGISLNWHKAE